MAGIRLHVVAPLVLVALGKCARDPSVYVRKCAANALPKLNDLRFEENVTAIEEVSFSSLFICLVLNTPSVPKKIVPLPFFVRPKKVSFLKVVKILL